MAQKLTSLLQLKTIQRSSSQFSYHVDESEDAGSSTKMNMFQAINSALDTALRQDDSTLIFGEDVGFGGVFRCTLDLQVALSSPNVSFFNHQAVCFVEKVRKRSSVQYAAV